jgi:hypothetical protein
LTRATWVVLACSGSLAGCGGAPDAAAKNRTFYDWTVSAGPAAAAQFEQRFPRLDQPEGPQSPEYIGVTVLRGGVRLSRPKAWSIREASSDPGQAFIQYVSPRAYSFAIYEKPDAPDELWRNVLSRFEDDVGSVGAKITGRRVPFATAGGQGRAYSIERNVEASKRPFISHSREVLLRGANRIVLVQTVHEGETLAGIDDELMRVLTSLEVL